MPSYICIDIWLVHYRKSVKQNNNKTKIDNTVVFIIFKLNAYKCKKAKFVHVNIKPNIYIINISKFIHKYIVY